MAAPQDVSIEWAREATYGTAGSTWRALDFLSGPLAYVKNTAQGKGLRVSQRVARSSRRVVTTVGGSMPFEFEAQTHGTGILWESALGAGTSTLVSGGLYQQVFTFGDAMPAISGRVSVPQATAAQWGVFTAPGGVCKSWEIDAPNADLVKIKMDWDFQTVTGSTAGTLAPTYPAVGNLLSFVGAVISTGTLTAPTTTALASAITTVSGRALNVKVDNSLNLGRFNSATGGGKKSKPVAGERKITAKVTIEYDAATYTDLVFNDGAINLIGTWTSGTDVLQVVLSDCRIEGDLPVPAAGDLVTHDLNLTGFDGGVAAQALWVVQRTADTAL